MTPKYTSENPNIALQSNWLTVDGNTLRADVLKDTRYKKTTVSSEQLESIVLLGRKSLVHGIEAFYTRQAALDPEATVDRPSIWTAQLGDTQQTEGQASQVFTELGHRNGGVLTSIDEIHPDFHLHWHAIRNAGFLPEVRRNHQKGHAGSWLLLRKPSLPDVLQHWFDQDPTVLSRKIDYMKAGERGHRRVMLRTYRMIGEVAVDHAPDELRSREQIGLILSMAAIKSALGDRDGYEDEVNDAFDYADNDTRIDVGAIRALQNSTYELDQ